MRTFPKCLVALVLGLMVVPLLGGCQGSSGAQYLNSTPPPGPNARPLKPNMHKKLPGPAKMASS